MTVIANIINDYNDKFGIPRQSLLADKIISKIRFVPPFDNADCLRGIEGFSHLWLIWEFSENKDKGWSPTVRPPRLGGNKRMGVFATRSPFRPNPIGLSCVKIEKVNLKGEPYILVSGADLKNGTPIYDIKPYLPYADSIENAKGGFAQEFEKYHLEVSCPDDILSIIPVEKRQGLIQILSQDPRPSYQSDGNRIYKLTYGDFEISFKVSDKLYVTDITVL